MVAGLYDSWVNPQTHEIKNTCTLLTDGPYQYLFDHGHDRSIIVLDKEKQLDYIQNKTRDVKNSFEFIRNSRVDQKWGYEVIKEVSKTSIAKNTPTEVELESIRKNIWHHA
jgi:putative SOS response-associated peptidase YedK